MEIQYFLTFLIKNYQFLAFKEKMVHKNGGERTFLKYKRPRCGQCRHMTSVRIAVINIRFSRSD